MLIQIRKNKKDFSETERRDFAQPLDKSGFTNPEFDRLYGIKKNPHTNTERDINKKKRYF